MRKIRLDDSCLNHLTNIPVGFTRKRAHTCILRNHIPKILCILLTGVAYAPDATCIATPLFPRKMFSDKSFASFLRALLPNATLADVASWLIQNDIQDNNTMRIDGIYVWNIKYPRFRFRSKLTTRRWESPEVDKNEQSVKHLRLMSN